VLLEFDEDAWEKKIVKIYKGLVYMEKVKYLEPHFSGSFMALADYIGNTLNNKFAAQSINSNFSGFMEKHAKGPGFNPSIHL